MEKIWTTIVKYTEDGSKVSCLCPFFECRNNNNHTFMVHLGKKTYTCIDCKVGGEAKSIEIEGSKITLFF